MKNKYPFMKYTLLASVIVAAVIFTSCASHSANENAGMDAAADVVGTVVLRPALEPPILLGYASNEYRVAKHRWPGNYDELSNFLEQTGDKTWPEFQSMKIRRMDFFEMADGKLKIHGDYTFSSPVTNSDGTVASGSVTVKDMSMTVGPTDPRAMKLSPETTEPKPATH